MVKRPNSMRHLDDAIRRIANRSPTGFVRVRTVMANAIVSSMLPDGVVKGGSAIKMRYGDAVTRFTTDLDTATATDVESYIEQLDHVLRAGWEGFTGHVASRTPASPEGVPGEYVMKPYDIKLAYLGKPWCTVMLEVGYNEIGDTDASDLVELSAVSDLFESIGFPTPGTVSLMTLDHQVAQKLHAASGLGDRARDLIDLQLIIARSSIDLVATRRICERLFAYRQMQKWPPVVTRRSGWEELYDEQAKGLPVLRSLDGAIEWTNALIARIQNAK